MPVILDARSLKALQIAATARRWSRVEALDSFAIPSQFDPGKVYIASPERCTCLDAEHHPDQLCKHSIAVSIVLALLAASAPRPTVNRMPVTTREE